MIALSLLVRATYMYGVVLHAHPVRGESHNQRNTTGEVATPSSLHSIYPKCISYVVVFDGQVMGVVGDDIDQWLLRYCVKFTKTTVVVVKNLVRN